MDNSQLKNIIRSLESTQEISFILVLTSISFCFLSALILKYLYINRANSITPKIEFSNLLIVISLITFLMIVIVKSSIALSLGLVGALSIVRFRTPIKEPEDLTYLFLSIALGVGYGSFQILDYFRNIYCGSNFNIYCFAKIKHKLKSRKLQLFY